MMTRLSPAMRAFLLPCLGLPLALVMGSILALRAPTLAPEEEAPVFVPVSTTYVPFALPITVSLPQGGHVNLTIGVGIDRRHGMSAMAGFAERENLIPQMVTTTLLAAADEIPLIDLHAALPALLLTRFNTELTNAGLPALVTEVFLTSWTLIS